MTFIKLPKADIADLQIYARIDDDGKCRMTCTFDNPELQAWIADGNTPQDGVLPV